MSAGALRVPQRRGVQLLHGGAGAGHLVHSACRLGVLSVHPLFYPPQFLEVQLEWTTTVRPVPQENEAGRGAWSGVLKTNTQHEPLKIAAPTVGQVARTGMRVKWVR